MARKARPRWNPDPGVCELVRVLLVLQGALALLSTLSTALTGMVTGTLPLLLVAVAINGFVAGLVLLLAGRIGRGSQRARRVVVVGEAFVLLSALIDLLLAIATAGKSLDLVSMVTRLAVPLAVIVLLRRSRARAPDTAPAHMTPIGG